MATVAFEEEGTGEGAGSQVNKSSSWQSRSDNRGAWEAGAEDRKSEASLAYIADPGQPGL